MTLAAVVLHRYGSELGRDLPMSVIVLSPFGASSFLPFPTIFQGHRHLGFAVINPKTQVAEKQVLFPLVFQRLTFYHKKLKKEERPCSESPLPHHPQLW